MKILQVTDFLKLAGLVVTLDIQKAFDSVNRLFLITALKRFGFDETLGGYKFYSEIKNVAPCKAPGLK